MSTNNEEGADEGALAGLLACGLCARAMLHPVVADCGHAVGCRACVETYFEKHIAANAKKRKATRITCARCGEAFAKPKAGKKFRVDHTLGDVCRLLKPGEFGPGRAASALDTLTHAVTELKSRMANHPIEGMHKQDLYRKKLFEFLDNQAKSVADLHFCNCTNRFDHWSQGVPVYPKYSTKAGKWYMSCPMWSPIGKDGGERPETCSFFKWIGERDVDRFGLKVS